MGPEIGNPRPSQVDASRFRGFRDLLEVCEHVVARGSEHASCFGQIPAPNLLLISQLLGFFRGTVFNSYSFASWPQVASHLRDGCLLQSRRESGQLCGSG